MKPTKTQQILAVSQVFTDADGKPVKKLFTRSGWSNLVNLHHGGKEYAKGGFKILKEFDPSENAVVEPPETKKEEDSEESGEEGSEELSIEEIESAILEGRDRDVQVDDINRFIKERKLKVALTGNKPEKLEAIRETLK